MKEDRDEILYIPAYEGGAFICPKCYGIAGAGVEPYKLKYCPECGQHLKIIGHKDFKDLAGKAKQFNGAEFEKIALVFMGDIRGIYKGRLEKALNNDNYIPGQMEITDFI